MKAIKAPLVLVGLLTLLSPLAMARVMDDCKTKYNPILLRNPERIQDNKTQDNKKTENKGQTNKNAERRKNPQSP